VNLSTEYASERTVSSGITSNWMKYQISSFEFSDLTVIYSIYSLFWIND